MIKRRKSLLKLIRLQQLGFTCLRDELVNCASVLADEKLLKNYTEPGNPVLINGTQRDAATFAIDFSRDGRWIATSQTDHTVMILNAYTGKVKNVLNDDDLRMERTVWTLQFHPADSTVLALGTLNGKVLVYKNNREFRRVSILDPTSEPTLPPSITSVAFDQRDGDLLVFATSCHLVFYDWINDEVIAKLRTEETRFVTFSPYTNLLVVSTSSPMISASEYLFIYFQRLDVLKAENVLELFLRFLNELNFAFLPDKLEDFKEIWRGVVQKMREIEVEEPTEKFRRVLQETLICIEHRLVELEAALLPLPNTTPSETESEENSNTSPNATPGEELDAVAVIVEFLSKFDTVDQMLVKRVVTRVERFLACAEDSNLSCWTPQSPAQYLRVWDCERDGLPILDFNLKVVAACNVHHNCTIAVNRDKVAVFDRNLCEVVSIASDKTFGSVLHVLPRTADIISLSFSPSNQYLLVVARKSWQLVVDVESGELMDLTHAYNLTNSMASHHFNSVKWSCCHGGGIVFGYNSSKFFSTSVTYLSHGITRRRNFAQRDEQLEE